MSDINIFPTNVDGDFTVSIGTTASECSGNKALLNRFQIIFFDEGLNFQAEDGTVISDDFGGRAKSILGTGRSLVNDDVVRAAMVVTIKNTVSSLIGSTDDATPATERLKSATLAGVEVVGDIVTAVIEVIPEELDSSTIPEFKLPLIGR